MTLRDIGDSGLLVTWDVIDVIDVRVGGMISFRHTTDATPDWTTANEIGNPVPGTAQSAVIDKQGAGGTYLTRVTDASGRESDVTETTDVVEFAGGGDGEDGEGIEFIFRRTTDDTAPATPTTTSTQDETDGHVPADWTDNPTGIDPDNPYEWASVRSGSTGDWGKFTAPFLFAHFGIDGAGFEFIFRSTTDDTAPATPTTTVTQDETDDHVPTNWDDDAPSPTSTNPYVWVSKRTGSTGDWGKFTAPTLWAVFSADGTDGEGIEFVFRRTASDTAPSTPTTTTNQDQTDGHVPTNWTDDPQGPTEALPFEWASKRVGSTGRLGQVHGT